MYRLHHDHVLASLVNNFGDEDTMLLGARHSPSDATKDSKGRGMGVRRGQRGNDPEPAFRERNTRQNLDLAFLATSSREDAI
jgi:hypothetical protein